MLFDYNNEKKEEVYIALEGLIIRRIESLGCFFEWREKNRIRRNPRNEITVVD